MSSEIQRESQALWNANADFWDAYMGEGGVFQTQLIGPATERLLELRAGETVLDIACGNGAFARRMAALGARVVACDFSAKFLERARGWTKEHADRIEYRLVDATDEAQLLALGKTRFDCAVCTMGMMDMATIEPLLSALSQLLKREGRFVFSVQHPCFNSNGAMKMYEEDERDGKLIGTYSIKVSRYIQPFAEKGLGIVDQPVPHYYFHRPLSVLLNACFRAGFLMDALEEPVFGVTTEGERTLSWLNFREIPPVVVVRMKLAP